MPYSLTCLYETILSGIFSSGLFSSPIFDVIGRGVSNATICDIALIEDVLPTNVSNLKEYYVGRKQCSPVHYSVHSITAAKAIKAFNAKAYGGYLKNLKMFSYHLPPKIMTCPVFKFIAYIYQKRFSNTSFIAHNLGKYDGIHILRVCLQLKIPVEVLQTGNNYTSIKLTKFNQIFIDSYKYFSIPLSKCAERYLLRESKSFFPHAKVNLDFLRYEGKYLPIDDYIDLRIDSSSSKREKEIFLKEKNSLTFQAALEVVRYNFLDTRITLLSVLAYLTQSFHLQDQLRQYFQTPNVPQTTQYIHPFSPPYLSNGSVR